MTDRTLSRILIHPVKSLGGQSVDNAALGRRGLQWDRHWMVVDPDGGFLTLREHPRMALVATRVDDRGLTLSAPDRPDLRIEHEESGESLTVQVWDDRCRALSAGRAAADWLSEFLGADCRLVRFPDDEQRQVDPRYAGPGDEVGFADGFPVNLLSQASLDHLNERLDEPVGIERFRPNLVIAGCEPHEEDRWRRIRIGEVEFRIGKSCSRCAVPNVDPATGERQREPVRTLGRYRRFGKKIHFGQNLLHDQPGTLKVGDPVVVMEEGEPVGR